MTDNRLWICAYQKVDDDETRDDPKYVTNAEELKHLARCVELLRGHTKTRCEKKMKSLV